MVELVAPKLRIIPKSIYTVKEIDGTEAVDTANNVILEQVRDRLLDKAADDYSKFVMTGSGSTQPSLHNCARPLKKNCKRMISGRILLIV